MSDKTESQTTSTFTTKPKKMILFEIVLLVIIFVSYHRFTNAQTGMPIEREVALYLYIPTYSCIIVFIVLSILDTNKNRHLNKLVVMNGILSSLFFGINLDKELHSSYHVTLSDMLNPHLKDYTISINALIIMFGIVLILTGIYFSAFIKKRKLQKNNECLPAKC